MARYRVRSADNTTWLDMCYSDFFVRNATNTGWIRIVPNGFAAVRNGSNTNWLAITCVDEVSDRCSEGDPYDPANPYNVGGCIEDSPGST